MTLARAHAAYLEPPAARQDKGYTEAIACEFPVRGVATITAGCRGEWEDVAFFVELPCGASGWVDLQAETPLLMAAWAALDAARGCV